MLQEQLTSTELDQSGKVAELITSVQLFLSLKFTLDISVL